MSKRSIGVNVSPEILEDALLWQSKTIDRIVHCNNRTPSKGTFLPYKHKQRTLLKKDAEYLKDLRVQLEEFQSQRFTNNSQMLTKIKTDIRGILDKNKRPKRVNIFSTFDNRLRQIREQTYAQVPDKKKHKIIPIQLNRYVGAKKNLRSRSVPKIAKNNVVTLNKGSILNAFMRFSGTPENDPFKTTESSFHPIISTQGQELHGMNIKTVSHGKRVRNLVLHKRVFTNPKTQQMGSTKENADSDSDSDGPTLLPPVIKSFATPRKITVTIPQPKS